MAMLNTPVRVHKYLHWPWQTLRRPLKLELPHDHRLPTHCGTLLTDIVSFCYLHAITGGAGQVLDAPSSTVIERRELWAGSFASGTPERRAQECHVHLRR
jgi:hypothetical protein